ncbi:MAG TPA: M50 family metallopeptidase [Candidatus Paceibacterota bacterium]
MSTTIIFLLVLTVLVFVHELGHFLAARLFKIRVDEFAIGFPPRVASWMWGKTRYAINLLPLGGYVKIYGENPDDERTSDSILSKPRWQQAIVLVAGVTFNVVFAWILLSLALMLGSRVSTAALPPELIKDPALTVVMVSPGSPADLAGLKAGDEILSITNSQQSLATSSLTVEGVQQIISSAEVTVDMTARQKASTTEGYMVRAFDMTPVEGISPGKKAIGISMDNIGEAKAPFFKAFYYGAQQTYYLTINVATGLADFLKSVVMGNASLKQVSGPVGIAGAVGESAQTGFSTLLVMAAVISANLAVLNLVPFPALDGGRLVVVFIESIIRRDINPKILMWVNGIGFLLLISLMILVTVKDVAALF